MVSPIPKRMDVREAALDLQRRSLSSMPRALDRFIYLASTRDYNTGRYYHDGLASRFTEDVACEALADCHREAFHQLLSCSLEEIVRQIEEYMRSTHTSPTDFVALWKGLEPYRVAVPMETEPLAAEFLFSNFKVALAILESRLSAHQAPRPGASPQPSPGQ